MKPRESALYLVVLILVVIFLVWGFWNRSNFTFKTYPTPSPQLPSGKYPTGTTFSNAEYQTYPPSVVTQQQYYQCIADECKGNTFDYPCLQRCHLKTYRRHMDTPDHADWVCYYHRHDEDAYYKCLAGAYAQWKYP